MTDFSSHQKINIYKLYTLSTLTKVFQKATWKISVTINPKNVIKTNESRKIVSRMNFFGRVWSENLPEVNTSMRIYLDTRKWNSCWLRAIHFTTHISSKCFALCEHECVATAENKGKTRLLSSRLECVWSRKKCIRSITSVALKLIFSFLPHLFSRYIRTFSAYALTLTYDCMKRRILMRTKEK